MGYDSLLLRSWAGRRVSVGVGFLFGEKFEIVDFGGWMDF